MTRLVCLGNRLIAADQAGPAVYDALAALDLGPGVELLDGGTAGLRLLALFDGVDEVIVVDGVEGFGAPGEVVELPGEAIAALAGDLGHAVGLPEVLRLLPLVCDPPPRVRLVGIESPADPAAVAAAAAMAARLARESAHALV